jgi:FtsP/CotA-like multicopper oxidase with cupredoxin domain
MFWALNGIASGEHLGEPLLTVGRGRSYILAFRNETAWDHPMHLHGHSFRVIRRDGRPTGHREWRDTVLVAPHETVEVAFVADNPGDWALHCHILEHQVSGMMAAIRVT